MRIAAAISTAFFLMGCGPGAEPASEPASAPAGVAAPQPVGAAMVGGSHAISGRTVTVSLPYRLADNLAWVAATPAADARPFVFKGLEVKPGGGPGGVDLAVFTYEADGPGEAKLAFGMVPAGKMLIGPESLVYKGEALKRYEADVRVE